jgi:lipopolysaccharide biosynthesis protein
VQRRDVRTDVALAVPFADADVDGVDPGLRIAVVCHIFHADLSALMFDAMVSIPGPVDVLISTDSYEKRDLILASFESWHRGRVEVRIVENRGRDVAPKLVTYVGEYAAYDLLLFLHSKKSTHSEAGESWRTGLLQTLAGSRETVDSVLRIFTTQPSIGIVLPQHPDWVREWVFWNGNYPKAFRLARRMGLRLPLLAPIDFPSGSMFWARPAALEPLMRLGLTQKQFPPERGQINKTTAHAIERLMLFSCELAGFDWIKIAGEGLVTGAAPTRTVGATGDLDLLIQQCAWRLLSGQVRGNRPEVRATTSSEVAAPTPRRS